MKQKDLKTLVDRNSSDSKAINSALIASAAIWGLKSGELSSVEIGDILTAKGALKKKWTLRKEIAFNVYARELYTEHESLVKYLEDYLSWRVTQKLGVTNIEQYRGLNSDSKLFLDSNGEAFKFTRRTKGSNANLQPTGMNSHFKKLFENAGMADATYKDFRRSLALQMYQQGKRKTGVIKDIMTYLGIRSYSAMRKILNGEKEHLKDLVSGIHNRI